jgi:branched-chain amino acid transport system permease protein
MSRRLALVATLAAAVVAADALARGTGNAFLLTQLTMAAYYTVVAAGLSLLMGYAGQISLGHAGFFAIGGYAAAALTTADLGSPQRGLAAGLAHLHVLVPHPDLFGGAEVWSVHPWAALAVAVALAVVIAFVLGVPILKLRGHYLAMATLGFGTIVQSLAVGSERLGGADGISGVPPLPLLPGVAVSGGAAVRVANYYVAWGLVAAVVLLLGNLVSSRVGRALRAIHGSEEAAGAMGVDTARTKLGTFVVSAGLAALAGALLTHFNGSIGPSEASVMKSIRYVAVVAVGGMGSLAGTVAASAALTFLSLRGTFGSLDDAVFGAILIAVMLFAPDGVLRGGGAAAALLRRVLGAGRTA